MVFVVVAFHISWSLISSSHLYFYGHLGLVCNYMVQQKGDVNVLSRKVYGFVSLNFGRLFPYMSFLPCTPLIKREYRVKINESAIKKNKKRCMRKLFFWPKVSSGFYKTMEGVIHNKYVRVILFLKYFSFSDPSTMVFTFP